LTGELSSFDLDFQSLLFGTIPSTFYRLLFFDTEPLGKDGAAKAKEEIAAHIRDFANRTQVSISLI
jgi:hypothetical protein